MQSKDHLDRLQLCTCNSLLASLISRDNVSKPRSYSDFRYTIYPTSPCERQTILTNDPRGLDGGLPGKYHAIGSTEEEERPKGGRLAIWVGFVTAQ